MTEPITLARPSGEIAPAELRIRAAVPYGYSLDWIRMQQGGTALGLSGFPTAPSNRATFDVRLRGEFRVAQCETSDGITLAFLARSVLGAVDPLEECGTEGDTWELQAALAHRQPLERLRGRINATASPDWQSLAQRCGIEPRLLDQLLNCLNRLSLQEETILWNSLSSAGEHEELRRWVQTASCWQTGTEASDAVRAELSGNGRFLQSPALAWLCAAGLFSFRASADAGPARPWGESALPMRNLTGSETSMAVLRRLSEIQNESPLEPAGWEGWNGFAATVARLAPRAVAALMLEACSPGGRTEELVAEISAPAEFGARQALERVLAGDLSAALEPDSPLRLTGGLLAHALLPKSVRVRLPFACCESPEAALLASDQTEVVAAAKGSLLAAGAGAGDASAECAVRAGFSILAAREARPGFAEGIETWRYRAQFHQPNAPAFLERLLEHYNVEAPPWPAGPACLTIDIHVPASAFLAWDSFPHSRDPEFRNALYRISRTVQQSLRRWISFLYFSSASGLPAVKNPTLYLVYAASAPRTAKKKGVFSYDVIDKEVVASAIRSAGNSYARLAQELGRSLGDAAPSHPFHSVSKKREDHALRYAWRFPKLFEALLLLDSSVIEQSLHLSEALRQIRFELQTDRARGQRHLLKETSALVKALKASFRFLPTPAMQSLAGLSLLEVTSALNGSGLGHSPAQATVTLETEEGTVVRCSRPGTPAAPEAGE